MLSEGTSAGKHRRILPESLPRAVVQKNLTALSYSVSVSLRFPVLAPCWRLEAQPARG